MNKHLSVFMAQNEKRAQDLEAFILANEPERKERPRSVIINGKRLKWNRMKGKVNI